ADIGDAHAGLDFHQRDDLFGFLIFVAIRVVEGFGDAVAAFFGFVGFVGVGGDLGVRRRAEKESSEDFHSDFSMGIASGGSIRKLSSDMRAMAARTDCSGVGSTVMTKGRSRQFSCGSCRTESIEIFSAASAAASWAMMPGRSSTRKRR